MSHSKMRFGKALWLMPSGRLKTRWLTQKQYNAMDFRKPHQHATFLGAIGGISLYGLITGRLFYEYEYAEDPLDTGRSWCHGIRADSWKRFPVFSERWIPNHHSVTFDSKASFGATASASSATYNHAVVSNSSGYMALF